MKKYDEGTKLLNLFIKNKWGRVIFFQMLSLKTLFFILNIFYEVHYTKVEDGVTEMWESNRAHNGG